MGVLWRHSLFHLALCLPPWWQTPPLLTTTVWSSKAAHPGHAHPCSNRTVATPWNLAFSRRPQSSARGGCQKERGGGQPPARPRREGWGGGALAARKGAGGRGRGRGPRGFAFGHRCPPRSRQNRTHASERLLSRGVGWQLSVAVRATVHATLTEVDPTSATRLCMRGGVWRERKGLAVLLLFGALGG